jgi:UDP-N-acetylenolpyruvoylglucosamine reductase
MRVDSQITAVDGGVSGGRDSGAESVCNVDYTFGSYQALVLVNHGGGSADSVLALAKMIQNKVQDTFGVPLLIEPIRY